MKFGAAFVAPPQVNLGAVAAGQIMIGGNKPGSPSKSYLVQIYEKKLSMIWLKRTLQSRYTSYHKTIFLQILRPDLLTKEIKFNYKHILKLKYIF